MSAASFVLLSSTASRAAGAREIRSLTGLRGLAAIFVVIFHEAGDFQGTGPAQTLLRHGYNAVDLFFVLSGFVMALTYGKSMTARGRLAGYFTFLGKRLARIYPLYAVMTLVTFVIFAFHLSHSKLDPNPGVMLVLNLLMVQAWGFAHSIVGPAWSISTEWAAYLVFPVLCGAALSRSLWKPLFLLALALIALGCLVLLPEHMVLGTQVRRLGPLDLYGIDTYAPVLRCIAGFSLGLIAYRARNAVSPRWSGPLGVAAVGVLLFPGTDLLFVIICAFMIASLSCDRGVLAAFLGSRPIFTLGVWSYSIYILHARFNPVRSAASELLNRAHVPGADQLAIVISTCTVIACAAATYRLLEKPGRNLLRRVFEQRRGDSIGVEPAAR